MSKPSLPQGTRDFGPDVVRKRNYIINTIKVVFEVYGFEPLETPAMENLDTLMGKYGEEGDKLIFKILNNGLNDPKNIDKAKLAFENVLQGKNDKHLTERALKYDLTIPFARYVAMNHGQLTFPFKRYQVQPVWRADRPQKGRYREFYQCDADVVGSTSLLNEIELTNIYDSVFATLGVAVEIKINNRKVLAALAEICGGADKITDITIAIDKLDKIGIDKVKEELLQRGLQQNQVDIITQYLDLSGDNFEKLEKIKNLLSASETGIKGIEELTYIINHPAASSLKNKLVIDFTLARGLNYYTGTIFEIKALDAQIGSIGGGGRYDDLTGLFGVPNVPGVGISFGVDRIYDVLEELKLFPRAVHSGTQVLFFNLGEAESNKSFELMQQLRSKAISCQLYHEQAKFDKQFRYAEKKNIPFVVMIGSRELENNVCNIKKLATGEQVSLPLSELGDYSFS
ncbi:histidine--tRNA ligase [Terrimonas sp.]|uniref:histidine--tRNA ligase n=1 Tax=Terrimonas sp. TaxID=1914338 RepID=UPI000D51CFCF|nr:histidine--tRNA ligase [Terrimonas sp.]PVD53243.1 histidine--tRNA ligase [Terrimonas sp.]